MIVGSLNIDYLTYIKNEHKIYNEVSSLALKGLIICPICNGNVAMHGTYKRKVIFSDINIQIVTIVQVRCKKCRKVHAIIPGFISPQKQYNLQTIENALKHSKLEICSADDSTIRRWRSVPEKD